LVLADNDPEALALLVTDLSLEGHEIVGEAFGGEQALELCRAHHPDAVVLDFRMPPGPNGVETAALAREEWPDLRIVVYTNYVNTNVARGARLANAILIEKGNLRTLRRALTDEG